jgi:hypothetical protein
MRGARCRSRRARPAGTERYQLLLTPLANPPAARKPVVKTLTCRSSGAQPVHAPASVSARPPSVSPNWSVSCRRSAGTLRPSCLVRPPRWRRQRPLTVDLVIKQQLHMFQGEGLSRTNRSGQLQLEVASSPATAGPCITTCRYFTLRNRSRDESFGRRNAPSPFPQVVPFVGRRDHCALCLASRIRVAYSPGSPAADPNPTRQRGPSLARRVRVSCWAAEVISTTQR